MKRCPKCSTDLDESAFNKDRSTPTGLATWCRECCRSKNKARYEADKPNRLAKQKVWQDANPDKVKANNRRQYLANREKRIAEALEWAKANRDKVRLKGQRDYEKNRDRVLERQREYAAENPEMFRAKAAARRAAVQRATPPWVDLREIGDFYVAARRLTEETGIPHEVDHIEPLRGKHSCGLHVPWNLQILTKAANASKGNKFKEAA